MSLGYDSQATTPNRDLRVLFDVDEIACLYQGVEIPLSAAQIGLGEQAGAGTGISVQLIGGDPSGWELTNLQSNPEKSHEWVPPEGVYYRWADLFVPQLGTDGKALVDEGPLFLSPADIPGMEVGVNGEPVQDTGDWFIIKKIVAGYATGLVQLTQDAFQFPGPDLLTQNAPMDRLALGKTDDPENTAYHLRFIVQATPGGIPDNVLTFYFGGDTLGGVDPLSGEARGCYCIAFRGSGAAVLYEHMRDPKIEGPHGNTFWRKVWQFRYAAPNAVADHWHAVNIRPQLHGAIRFEVTSTDVADRISGPSEQGGPHFSTRPPNPHAAQFVTNATISGPIGSSFTTGTGPIRVDVRRDLLLWFQISRSAYPVLPDYGVLDDQTRLFYSPFSPDSLLGSAVNIWLQMDADVPEGTAIIPTLYVVNEDGTDGAPLAGEGYSPTYWRFEGVATKQLYRAQYKFQTNDPFATPRLFYATLYKEPIFEQALGLNIAATPATHGAEGGGASVTGTDRDPRHESGSALISDQAGELILLRRRARVRSKIQIAYEEGTESKKGAGNEWHVCNLFEGEMSHCEGQLLGFSENGWPSPDWRDFEATFCGLWTRGEDVYNFYRGVFDPHLQTDPNTGLDIARRITDLASDILYNLCGVPFEEMDIPDADVMFLPSLAVGQADYMLAPRSRPWDYVMRLFHDYMGWVFFRDHNAGPLGRDRSPRGMWRARPEADLFDPGAPLWSFVFGPNLIPKAAPVPGPLPPPTGGGGIAPQFAPFGPVHDPFSYPEQTSFIQRATYKDYVEPPEANAIFVIAPNNSTQFSGGAGMFKNSSFIYNLDSFNAIPGTPTANDRLHPDFLGRMVPFVLLDPGLGKIPDDPGAKPGSGVQAACDRLCYYLYQRIGHARKRFRFRAPLALVKDDTDVFLNGRRRPLRMNDPILVNGFAAVLRSVDFDAPLQTSRMWANYNGVFQGVGNAIPM